MTKKQNKEGISVIRTEIVELTTIKAIAFRQKLMAGGAGVTVIRYDYDQPGIASISKTSGEAIPAANTPKDMYPQEVFNEAIKLTFGMPYKKRGMVKVDKKAAVEEVAPEPAEEETEEEVVIDSRDYQKLVDHYTDKNGKLSYELINKDLIKFAHSSKTVHSMLEEGDSVKKIRTYIVSTKFRNVTGDKKLSEAQAVKMGELLDEVSPKSLFKPLDSELRKMSAVQKKK